MHHSLNPFPYLVPALLLIACGTGALPVRADTFAPADLAMAEQHTILPPGSVDITLDVADTPEKMAWGLMGIAALPPDQGMLFPYDPPRPACIWMFNVYIDLAVAFIDGTDTIRELHTAQAEPSILDARHRLSSVKELQTLQPNDPVVRYFAARSIRSKGPMRYVLEMNQGWFSFHNIQIGDIVEWQTGQTFATIHRSLNLSAFLPKGTQPILLNVSAAGPLSVWLPQGSPTVSVSFLDSGKDIIESAVLKEATGFSTLKPVQHVLISSHP